jgi:hypothetical protein
LGLWAQRTKTTCQAAHTAARQAKKGTVGRPEFFGAKGCAHQAGSIVIGDAQQKVADLVGEYASERARQFRIRNDSDHCWSACVSECQHTLGRIE